MKPDEILKPVYDRFIESNKKSEIPVFPFIWYFNKPENDDLSKIELKKYVICRSYDEHLSEIESILNDDALFIGTPEATAYFENNMTDELRILKNKIVEMDKNGDYSYLFWSK
jgi:hypothetical protein